MCGGYRIGAGARRLDLNRMERIVALHRVLEARSTGETAGRATSPQRLVYYRDQWYLDCWDEDRQGLRTFALDRMSSAEVLPSAARDVPAEELIEVFGAGYGLFSGPVRGEARLRFQPERARWVADERWHGRQTSRRLPDGRLELTVPYSEVDELLGEIPVRAGCRGRRTAGVGGIGSREVGEGGRAVPLTCRSRSFSASSVRF